MRTPIASLLAAALVTAACSKDGAGPTPDPVPQTPAVMTLLGASNATDRYTSEVWVRGQTAYTTTWSTRSGMPGNAVRIWDVSGAVPRMVDSVIVASAGTTGDVQVSDDGQYLFVAVEPTPNGALMVYSLADPRRPVLVTRYATTRGVHTAEIQRVNGTLYAFLAINSGSGQPGRLSIVSLANPASPVEVNGSITGTPFLHDVFVRDGILFTAQWNGGMGIWDIGGGGRGGTPASPVAISNLVTVGGQVHNIFWYHASPTLKRYAFVGEEGPAALFSFSSGDIHVVDISNMAQPREVAFFRVNGAGTHNFSVDEARGVLYAAYYNGGVRALDIRGDLGGCTAAQKSLDGRCDLGLMRRELANTGTTGNRPVFVWGVHYLDGKLYASDMLTGLWKYDGVVPK